MTHLRNRIVAACLESRTYDELYKQCMEALDEQDKSEASKYASALKVIATWAAFPAMTTHAQIRECALNALAKDVEG